MSGTPCASSGQCENSALAAEVCKALAFRVLTRIPCTSGGRHRVICAPRPPPAPDSCAGAAVYLLADAMRRQEDNCDCKFGCRVSWNLADIAGSGNPSA